MTKNRAGFAAGYSQEKYNLSVGHIRNFSKIIDNEIPTINPIIANKYKINFINMEALHNVLEMKIFKMAQPVPKKLKGAATYNSKYKEEWFSLPSQSCKWKRVCFLLYSL